MEKPREQKSLYVCFEEHRRDSKRRRGYSSYSVYSVNFKDVLTCLVSHTKLKPDVRHVVSIERDTPPRFMGCGLLGSRIVFAGGGTKDGNNDGGLVLALDTEDPDSKLEGLPRMKGRKPRPLLWEVKGKLYALTGGCRGAGAVEQWETFRPQAPGFECFNPQLNSWSPMPQPPFFDPKDPFYPVHFSYAIVSTTLLMTIACSNYGILGFDVEKDCFDHQWRQVEHPMFGGSDSFPFDGSAFMLQIDDSEYGHQWIMLTYECLKEQPINAYKFTKKSFQPIKGLPLPTNAGLPDMIDVPPPEYQFVHLGGNDVGLVLTRFFCTSEFGWKADNELVRVLLLTLQVSDDDLKLVACCTFDCNQPKETYDSELLGCFFL